MALLPKRATRTRVWVSAASLAAVGPAVWIGGAVAPRHVAALPAHLQGAGLGAAIVIEHARDARFTLPAGFEELTRYRYGDTGVLLAEAPTEDSA